jgi:hypothetical protein
MMIGYLFAATFGVIWLAWWGCLVGVGRVNFSIKSLAVLLLGFALIFAFFGNVGRLPKL